MRWLAVPLAALLLLVPDTSSAREWELGVSALGLVNGSFLDEPDSGDKFDTFNGVQRRIAYPGFGGVGGGGGLTVLCSWRGVIGLETGLLLSKDQGTGDINDQDIDLANTSMHVPFLVRLAVPTSGARPFIFGGGELVMPLSSSVETTDLAEAAGADFSAEADTYWAWAFGLGFEIMLPVEGVDLRIPFILKGTKTPSVGDSADGRLDCLNAICSEVRWDTTWQYQASVSLGLAWYFL